MGRRRSDEETVPLRRSEGNRREGVRQMLDQQGSVPQFTLRATVVGLLVGTLVCFSNMYFGLQTGWVSMMSMPSSLIGFAIFKVLAKNLEFPFTPVENVLVQTVAVAVGSMPLSAGFVGVIPALEKLLSVEEGGPLNFSVFQLIVWSMGVAFFGVFFAVPLRKQFIIKEKLKFPSGTATALMISVLHGKELNTTSRAGYEPIAQELGGSAFDRSRAEANTSWESKMKILIYSFAISGVYTLLTYFFPLLRDLPVFGSSLATTWLWTLNPSPAYIGQGIIMGTSTTLHMLLGALVGWGLLSPLAKNSGWAPGPASDWREGVRGWIVWVSVAVMLVDSVISLGVLVYDPVRNAVMYLMGNITAVDDMADSSTRISRSRQGHEPNTSRRRTEQYASCITEDEDLPNVDSSPHNQVSNEVVIMGLLLSGMLCITTASIVFDQMPLYSIIIAFLLALVLSVIGVRALGQTDLNPVSGISKLTQLIFALVVPASNPNAVLVNLVAGAVSEAGAQQAGDIMQDLKTGHLIGAAPRAQFHGQLIGSVVGAIVSAAVYRLYNSVYEIPSKLFQVPTAYIWIDCSRLVYGQGLPPYAREFASLFALVFTITTLTKISLKNRPFVSSLIPGGIAFAVGMYNVPSFTLARAVGGLLEWVWRRYLQSKYGGTPLVILASGLILGEGLMSIVNLAMASFGVPCWGS
ncbi:OPT superfamily oligopeptide transporter [Terfezia boudieri ATCC MYA-4762]|uniref:OPT superfamily oligopeptide transporter n=1 Tax=Terfezia boudieri ATCC MYA-4762 TaxID=1051890 RepID=A0A3N4LCK6_9PEZI|nr:OPT superfamily oligopeptide transporter [Terfezia boudieri ATCC MYA-4762]